jgi:hypothetical protein
LEFDGTISTVDALNVESGGTVSSGVDGYDVLFSSSPDPLNSATAYYHTSFVKGVDNLTHQSPGLSDGTIHAFVRTRDYAGQSDERLLNLLAAGLKVRIDRHQTQAKHPEHLDDLFVDWRFEIYRKKARLQEVPSVRSKCSTSSLPTPSGLPNGSRFCCVSSMDTSEAYLPGDPRQ